MNSHSQFREHLLGFQSQFSWNMPSNLVGRGRRSHGCADANKAALREFEAGLRRSIKQADTGSVKSFKTKEEFRDHLKNLE